MAEHLIFLFRLQLSLQCRNTPGPIEQWAACNRQKAIQQCTPVMHGHGYFPFSTVFRQIKIGGHKTIDCRHVLLVKVILSDCHIRLHHLSVRGVSPGSQSHVRKVCVSLVIDDLRCRLSGNRPVQFVLYRSKETSCLWCLSIIVDRKCINICNLLIEAAFAGTYFTNVFK